MCFSLWHRRAVQLACTLNRVRSLPETSPLCKRLKEFRPTSLEPNFFSKAQEAHEWLLGQPYTEMPQSANPPLRPPWEPGFAPPPRGGQTFRQTARTQLREKQRAIYRFHEKGQHYRRFRPEISERRFLADLHSFPRSRILLRLRSGHSRLAAHDRTTEETSCRCGDRLTADHILLQCNHEASFSIKRETLFSKLREHISFARSPTTEQLLIPPPLLTPQKQRIFLQLVIDFVSALPHDL